MLDPYTSLYTLPFQPSDGTITVVILSNIPPWWNCSNWWFHKPFLLYIFLFYQTPFIAIFIEIPELPTFLPSTHSPFPPLILTSYFSSKCKYLKIPIQKEAIIVKENGSIPFSTLDVTLPVSPVQDKSKWWNFIQDLLRRSTSEVQ